MALAVDVAKHDGIAGPLIFSSRRSSPTSHEMLKVGNSERRRTDDIDVVVTALFPPAKTEVRVTTLMARDGCRKSWFPLGFPSAGTSPRLELPR